MRTRSEPSSRAAPHARLRCVPAARPKRPSSSSRWLRLVSPPSAEQWVVKVERERLGIFVLIFVAIFFVFAYLLNREYWKDVH